MSDRSSVISCIHNSLVDRSFDVASPCVHVCVCVCVCGLLSSWFTVVLVREVIRWAMRKLGVEEWLVSAVMSVYRCKNSNLSEQLTVIVAVLR